LYDRLVIPRPPTLAEETPKAGRPSQRARWESEEWDPNRLDRLLDILREHELALELPWGQQARDDWRNLYEGAALPVIGSKRAEILEMARNDIENAKSQMPNQAPYVATAGLIATYVANELQHKVLQRLVALAKTPGVSIEPVIAYASYGEFQGEQAVKRAAEKADQDLALDSANPYGLFGWEFFIPEDADASDCDLLKRACKLAVRQDIREHRQSFHYWLKQMHDGRVDPEAARADMLKRLQEYQKIVAGSGWKTVTRYVAKFAPVSGPLLQLLRVFVPGVPEFLALGAGVAGAGAPLIVEGLLPENKPDERVRPAALVHDIRRFFGKNSVA
jgi:hypothetical protein